MTSKKSGGSRERREPMGTKADEVDRAARGRTASSGTPVHVRNTTSGESLDKEWVRQRLGFKLGKFARRIDRVDLTLGDDSGPTGKPTVRATLRLQIPKREPISVSARGTSATLAFSAALRSCERTLRRHVERKETARKAPR